MTSENDKMSKVMQIQKYSNKLNDICEWSKWAKEIPLISFPQSWKVQIIPPFLGAIIRFKVYVDEKRYVSVYLDCYNVLAWYKRPYWKVFPVGGDIESIPMNDTKELIKTIGKGLRQLK